MQHVDSLELISMGELSLKHVDSMELIPVHLSEPSTDDNTKLCSPSTVRFAEGEVHGDSNASEPISASNSEKAVEHEAFRIRPMANAMANMLDDAFSVRPRLAMLCSLPHVDSVELLSSLVGDGDDGDVVVQKSRPDSPRRLYPRRPMGRRLFDVRPLSMTSDMRG